MGTSVCSQLNGYSRATKAKMQRDNSAMENKRETVKQSEKQISRPTDRLTLWSVESRTMSSLSHNLKSYTSKLARDEDNRSFQQNGGEEYDDVVGS